MVMEMTHQQEKLLEESAGKNQDNNADGLVFIFMLKVKLSYKMGVIEVPYLLLLIIIYILRVM